MVLTPRKIIYLAVSNYLTPEISDALFDEISKRHPLTDNSFLKIVGKYFDFNLLKDRPFIKEDIWIFNYLMYQVKKNDDFNPLRSGEEISLKGRLPKKALIVKYENQIILPQYKLLESAHKILKYL